jgi:hypothetical protein
MKRRTTVLVSFVGLCAVAQQATEPQLRLRILVDKEEYSLKEKVTVKAELTNITSKTLASLYQTGTVRRQGPDLLLQRVNPPAANRSATSLFVMLTAEAHLARHWILKLENAG